MLTTTMMNMKGVIQRFEKAGPGQRVRITIGGVPVTQDVANRIGADRYAPEPHRAVGLVPRLQDKQLEEER